MQTWERIKVMNNRTQAIIDKEAIVHVLDIAMCIHGNAAVANGGMLFLAHFHSPRRPCIN